VSRTPVAEKEVTFNRVFDAPLDLVWAVWTEPAHVANWWGPHQFTNPVCEWDARPGGKIYIVMKGMGMEHAMTGEFREVEPKRRLVFFSAVPDPEGGSILEALTTVEFIERGQQTEITLHGHGVGFADAAVFMLQGMEMGWTQSLERFEAALAAASGNSQ